MRERNKRPLITGELLSRYFIIVSCDATHFCSTPSVWQNETCGLMRLLLLRLDHRELGKDARPSTNVIAKPRVLMFNNWLGWRGLGMMTGTGSRMRVRLRYKMSSCENRSFGRLSVGFAQRCKKRMNCSRRLWVMWGMVCLVKGPPWCQHRDWYMVSSLMTKHVKPLRSGRAAGSDGAGVHSAQFRKLQRWDQRWTLKSQHL